MKNLEVLEFRQAIWNFISESNIPEVVKTIVLNQILEEQEKIALQVVEQERKQKEQAVQEENEKAEAE